MNNNVLLCFVLCVFVVGCLFVMVSVLYGVGVYVFYVDVMFYLILLVDQIGVCQGIQQFMFVFVVVGNGCVLLWGGVQLIGNGVSGGLLIVLFVLIVSYCVKGGEVVVLFGGVNGMLLMQVCLMVFVLKSVYQMVIDMYGFMYIDFDIEGVLQQDMVVVVCNFQVVV